MKIQLRQKLFIVGLSVLAFTSCKKEGDSNFTNSESSLLSSNAGISVEEDADAVTMGEAGPVAGQAHKLPDCATITESSETFPKEIVIDFGNGCTDRKGRTKKGKIIINATDHMLNDGAVRTVTFDNFFVNNRQIEGTRITTNTGTNEDGNIVFTRTVNTTHTGDRGSATRDFQGSAELIEGAETEERDDNVFLLSGNETLTLPNGGTVTRSTIDPILVSRHCRYPQSGIVEIVGPRRSGTIDFGSGTCDDQATVTKDGEIHEVDLDEMSFRKRKK